MRIIAFAGLGQAGKTTAATASAARLFELGFRPQIEQFAGPLKKAAAVLGFHKGGDTDDLYRWFCQTTGERARREDPDWFVNLMRNRLDVLGQEEIARINEGGPFHETVVLIDDLRFNNERVLVHEYSGASVFISSMRRLTDMDAGWRQHVSETMATLYERGEIADERFDMSVSNNDPKGIAAFEATIQSLAERYVSEARELR